MAFLKNHLNVLTLIRPSTTFSLREKESTGTRLAKSLSDAAAASWSAVLRTALDRAPKRQGLRHYTTLTRITKHPIPSGRGRQITN